MESKSAKSEPEEVEPWQLDDCYATWLEWVRINRERVERERQS